MLTKPSAELTLFDTPSRLTFARSRNSWAPKVLASFDDARPKGDLSRYARGTSFASNGSFRSGLPGPLKFSSGEATTFSDYPQFGLRQHTLDEGVTIYNSFVDFYS